jgi:hypothetical protein
VILAHTQTGKDCRNLYQALNSLAQTYLRDIYEKHYERVSLKVLCGVQNSAKLFIDGELETFFQVDESYHKNVNGVFFRPKHNQIVVAGESRIHFFHGDTYEFEDEIDMKRDKIILMKFHPDGNLLAVLTNACQSLNTIHIFNLSNRNKLLHQEKYLGFDNPMQVFFSSKQSSIFLVLYDPETTLFRGIFRWDYCEYQYSTDSLPFRRGLRQMIPSELTLPFVEHMWDNLPYHEPFLISFPEGQEYQIALAGCPILWKSTNKIENPCFVNNGKWLLFQENNDILKVVDWKDKTVLHEWNWTSQFELPGWKKLLHIDVKN